MNSSWYPIEVMYFRKCYSISQDLLDYFSSIEIEKELVVESDEYEYLLKIPRIYSMPAPEILHQLRTRLLIEQNKIFDTIGTEDEYTHNEFWGIGSYSSIIASNLNSISMLILYLERRINWEDFIDAIHPDRDEQTFIEENIEPYPDEWDWSNVYIHFSYSF